MICMYAHQEANITPTNLMTKQPENRLVQHKIFVTSDSVSETQLYIYWERFSIGISPLT